MHIARTLERVSMAAFELPAAAFVAGILPSRRASFPELSTRAKMRGYDPFRP